MRPHLRKPLRGIALRVFFQCRLQRLSSIPARAKRHPDLCQIWGNRGSKLPQLFGITAHHASPRLGQLLACLSQLVAPWPYLNSVYHGRKPLFSLSEQVGIAPPQSQEPLFHVEQRAIEQPATPLWSAGEERQALRIHQDQRETAGPTPTGRVLSRHSLWLAPGRRWYFSIPITNGRPPLAPAPDNATRGGFVLNHGLGLVGCEKNGPTPSK